jgi:predicted  nucleic acid-binding Zn-ribbon protein
MNLEISVPQLITICSAVAGGYWYLAKKIVGQFQVSLDAKFEANEKLRTAASKKWDESNVSMQDSITALSDRLIKVESEMKHAPTAKEFSALSQSVAVVRGENQTQTELLKRIENQMALMHEWMLENK